MTHKSSIDVQLEQSTVEMAGLIPKFAAMRQRASEVVPKMYFDYVDGGSGDEITLRENREAWQRIRILPRVMRGIQRVDTSCTLLGMKWEMPLMIAPMALHGAMHTEGECATARAAEKCGIPMCVSMFASKDVVDIVDAKVQTMLLQQIYLLKDDAFMEALLKNIYKQGCRYVVLTVDAPVMGTREKDVENKFSLNATPLAITKRGYGDHSVDDSLDFMTLFQKGMKDCDWSAIAWIKNVIPVKVLVKGVLSPLDAALAVDHGVDGIIVSNHGGRQIDTVVTAVDVLPQIAASVNKRVPILVDGGIQRGSDIVKALALGASAVLIGRPILYALASGGEEQVVKVLEGIQKEFYQSLFLCGFSSVDEITADVLFKG